MEHLHLKWRQRRVSSFLLALVAVVLSWATCPSAQTLESPANNIHLDIAEGDLQVNVDSTPYSDSSSKLSQKNTHPKSVEDAIAFDKLYAEGVNAYDGQLWYSCATKLERAVKGYRIYKQVLSDCRVSCKKDSSSSKLNNLTSSVDNFEVIAFFLKKADCFRRCADVSLGDDYKVLPERIKEAFEKRLPYQYLQFCYFKLEQLPKAASAAYTYYLTNSGDTDTKQNILYYRDSANVPQEEFVDLEIMPHKESYIRAMVAYTSEEWETVVSSLEQSLKEYYVQHQRCLVDCEAKHFMKGSEFSSGVADWMINILICQLDCEDELATIYTEPMEFFLQDMYHYLQFAAFQVRDFKKVVEATASFLVFNSSHSVMNDNKKVLIAKKGYTEDDFKPRQEVVDYLAVRQEMQELMDVINKDYRWAVKINPPEEEDHYTALENLNKYLTDEDDWMTRYEQLGMHLIAKSVDLNREERFVTDGLLKSEECEDLMTLTQSLKKEKSGSQTFNLNVAQQRLEASQEEDYEASLRMFVRATEVVRHYTQRYLNPDIAYFLKKTAIVCWSSLEDTAEELTCFPQEDGTCVEFENMSDELYSDLYTTVTYLNTADEDGDFLFLNEEKGTDRSFGTKCGRTIGFNTGDRHTLKIPKKDFKRCALVLRYTIDPSEDEKEYRNMIDLLHRVDELRLANARQTPQEVMKKFAADGLKIVKEAEELKGKERFVADQLASDSQCNTLMNLVVEFGKKGDGYDGKKSPHTHNELFAGLSMLELSQLAHEDMITSGALRTFLDLSENSRLLVEKYFNLTRPLYFDFTHLVCRTAVDDTNSKRDDLSHPVHSDNCVLQPDGTCIKDYPAFTQRDYSAILYLNDQFEGGEFFFAHANTSEQVSVRPKCGRLVGFNAGHFHGVRAVRSGQRCALALWFTHNPNFKELAHIQARKFLKEKEQENQAATPREDL